MGMETIDTHQAERWFARLHAPDCTRGEREAFERWRGESRDNETAYAEIERLFARSADLKNDPAILAATRTVKRARRQTALRGWRIAGVAASLAAAAVLILAVDFRFRPASPVAAQHFATGIGERHSEILADGSTILLDTSSAVAVRIDDKERHIVLERGQVQFQVVHRPGQPFVVEVGDGVVRDIGTQFQVRLDGPKVTVTLLEGAVSVSAPSSGQSMPASLHQETLAPGQQLAFDDKGLWSKRDVDLKAALGWTQGDLVFENSPLGEIVQEMNRYTTTRIKLGDPALKTIPISGVFHQGDQQSLLLALQSGWSLRNQRNNGDIVLYRNRN